MNVDEDKTVDDIAAEWKAVADLRDKKIEELQRECMQLKGEVQQAKVTVRSDVHVAISK